MITLVAKQLQAQIKANTVLWDMYKGAVFWAEAPEASKPPYIVYAHVRGGDENTTKMEYIDTVWRVTATMTSNKDMVRSYELIRETFHDKMPVAVTGVTPYTTMYEKQPIQMVYRLQNFIYYVVGGDYRIRLKIGE